MKMRICFQSARFKTSRLLAGIVALGALTLGTGNASAGAEEPAPEVAACRVVVTAKFTLPQVSQSIMGSQEAVLAAAWKNPAGQVRLLNQNQFSALRLDWAAFAAQTGAASSCALAQIKPELIRDARGVLECAILRAGQPGDNVTGVVLAPDFLKRYAPLFGSKLLVVIPDQRTVYLFPKLASRYPDYAQRVLAVYRKSPNPVSREVYELSATGLRAIGAYEEP